MSATDDFTKSERRTLRELSALAFRRELKRELAPVVTSCQAYAAGVTDELALDDALREYARGASKELALRYADRQPYLAVVRALALGVLDESDAPAALRPKLERGVEAMREVMRAKR